VYVNQGEFFLSHANVETSLAIAFVMRDDRLFVLVYQPVIITYLCGKRESTHTIIVFVRMRLFPVC